MGNCAMQEDGFINFTAVIQPAVYALLYQGKVKYIGKSKMPAARIASHRHTGKPIETIFGKKRIEKIVYDEVWIRPCTLRVIDTIEQEMIKKYFPRFNILYKGCVPCSNLNELVKQLAPVSLQLPPSPPIRRRV